MQLPYEAIEDRLFDNNKRSIIFEFEGKFYFTLYNSFGGPWEFLENEEPIACIEVKRKRMMGAQWVPVEVENGV